MFELTKRKVVIGAAVGGGALLAGMAWWWWLPSMACERAVEAAERLTGMDVAVGDASMRLRGVVLEDVVLTGRHGGLEVGIEEIGVRAGFLGLGGASAIEAIQVRHPRVAVDLTHEGIGESLAAIREARAARADTSDAPGDGDGGDEGERAIEALEITVEVDDALGPLVRVADGGLSRSEGVWQLSAASVQLGGEPSDVLRLTEPRMRAGRDEEGAWTVLGAELGAGELVWARRGEQPENEENPTDSDDSDGGLTRLRAAIAQLRGPAEEPEPEPEDSGSEGPLSHLAPDATVELRDFTVHTRTEEGQHTVLADLSLTFSRDAEGVVHAEGEGVPGQTGSLRWDLSLVPEELRAEGTVGFEELPLALVAPMLPSIPWYEPERASLDGDVVIRAEAADRIAVSGSVGLRDAALYSTRIGPDPIENIELRVAGEGVWMPPRRRLELASAQISMGRAEADLRGAVEWRPDGYTFDLTGTLPPTPCAVAIGAIPRDLLADLAAFSFRGTMGARVHLELDSENLEAADLDLDVSEACEFETVPHVADLTRVEAPFLHRVREPDGSWFEMTTGPGTGNWTSIYSTSPFLVHAILAHEDASFFRHGGFAPWAIRDALIRNLRHGRFVYGASTITMQLAKNLFLHREKTLARKVQEVLLTWWLEKALDKTDILELYLNVIEYGPAVYGIRNAAWHYFGRDPAELSPAESAYLASVLPAPKRTAGQYERGAPSERTQNRVRRLLSHMGSRGRIDQAALDYALRELATLRFHRTGDAPPAPRRLEGTTRSLPFVNRGLLDPWEDDWEAWDDPEPEGDVQAMPEQINGG